MHSAEKSLLVTGANRGIAKMDGTGKLSNKIALMTGGFGNDGGQGWS
jgi:hypothetical protein